ncbi:Ceramide-1-phosphate transfer protein [Orchesella cincta]|uniref:Ceramide-1-phosphate transfer protein n=1 Tax=Orchesella cincta TaxID=48709 RepID=A0A1D2NL55_ORCCI|nr:Ceramide-1-phosphate transfer protein [Orchesella cincta]
MTSVSLVAKAAREVEAINNVPDNVPPEHHEKFLEQLTVMQGSIWDYSDSQPWFLVGLHKNNPPATREVLESLMKAHRITDPTPKTRRRGTLKLLGAGELTESPDEHDRKNVDELAATTGEFSSEGSKFSAERKFSVHPEMKIVIKKTVELISDMSKSCELVFHATRACAKFLTYPTPSIPSDNFLFGHAKGWIWLIYKGFAYFNYGKADKKMVDTSLKVFRREMSLLAKEVNSCISDLKPFLTELKKLNAVIVKEAKFLKKHHRVWIGPVDHYFRFTDELKTKRNLLVDPREDRFFPPDWIFEPHPSQTKFKWDFFHFQWVNMNRDWLDCEFEIRSDYSLHWRPYTSYSPELQTELMVHLIHHLKALIEECHNFHRINMRLSFDSQEIKFLKFAVEGILKLKLTQSNKESVEFITNITRRLFEDLIMLEKTCEEYVSNLEWIATIIEPCYWSMNKWLPDDLILPLEFSARKRRRRIQKFCHCDCVQGRKEFLELFGEPYLHVVLLRSPISISQLQKFFPSKDRIQDEEIPAPYAINACGISKGYKSSIFDAGIGREQPLPIHHPLPKFKKHLEQLVNIFDILRLIEETMECEIRSKDDKMDVDIEKYLVIMEEVQRFLAVFGTIFNSMMTDLKERVENIELLMYHNLPEYYETLDEMLAYEKSKQTENLETSGTKAFVRLYRMFQFIVYFIEKVNELEDSEVTFYACKGAYYKSYAKTQSWIYQKSAVFSMYSLPSKVEMFTSLFAELEKVEVDMKIKEFVEQGYKLIDVCENVMKSQNITF